MLQVKYTFVFINFTFLDDARENGSGTVAFLAPKWMLLSLKL